VSSLTAQISFLDEEIAVLRRRLADSPRQVRLLEERLRETEASLTSVTAQNERLASTLREARDQIVALKEEVDRLAQPPSGFGVFLAACEDSTADVFTGGRKMRVNVSPNVDLEALRPGQEVVLNEALNIVIAQGYETAGEVVMLYHDIGGLSSQIEQIRDAIELPYLHADLFREHQPRPAAGTSFFLNIKGPELLNKYAGVLTELPLHPGDLPSAAPPCWPIPGMCSINGVYMPSGVRRDR
jgi:ATP-dependent 26S proteasome regulatory subunit